MNKRLRKKKHLKEFKEFIFDLKFTKIDLNFDEDEFFCNFIDFIESENLSVGGTSNKNKFNFIVSHNKNKLNTYNKDKLINWLINNNCNDILIGDFYDAWYGPFPVRL
jgi:uncharacterized protein YggL (DUF469 family)